MNDERTCGRRDEAEGPAVYETVRVEKTKNVCPMCEDYARHQASKPVVVMCCEGACPRGEIARQAANILSHRLAPEKTARLCLGGAFTKDTGQRGFGRNGVRVIAVEGLLSGMRKQDDEGRDFRFGAGSDRRGRALRVRSQPVRD